MHTNRIIIVMLGAAAIVQTGCKEGAQERRYRAVSGTATRIDADTGEVSMLWTRTPGHEEQVSGRVTRDTEILINGISAGLQDVRVGDQALATVYLSDDYEYWVVTRVEIEREESYILHKDLSEPRAHEPGVDGS